MSARETANAIPLHFPERTDRGVAIQAFGQRFIGHTRFRRAWRRRDGHKIASQAVGPLVGVHGFFT